MLREQRIMERMVNELGEELNEYMANFYKCELWVIKEGEVITNKTFKRIVNIIADYNLTTGDKIMENAFNLIDDKKATFELISYLSQYYLKNGGDSLLIKTLSFCHTLFMTMVFTNLSAVDVLNKAIKSDLLYTEYSLWVTIKYKLGFEKRPYKITSDGSSITLISVLRGTPLQVTTKDILEYKEL